ncbi:MAG: ABC transporter substrate-binding protein [Chloroflexi bacterium]|nr:ABC transporter substrate-binding protein [Chloroflexota bacterium]
MTKYIRILVYVLMGMAAAYLLLVVQPGDSTRKDGRVVVTYWEKWSGEDAAAMQQVVDDFNNTVGKRKGIFVQYLSMSDVDQKTLVATAAGVPPDVAGLWNTQVAQFAEINALDPLDDFAAAHGITASYYKPVLWEGCHYKGHLWALVSACGSQALYYNKLAFARKAGALRAAGLDPDRPPRTLDELDRYAAVLDEYDTLPNGFKRIKQTGFLPLEPGWYLSYIGYWFGSPIYDSRTDRILLDDPRMIRAFRWIRSYSLRLGKDSVSDFRSGFGSYNSTQNPFITGTVAMEMQGPWMQATFEKFRPWINHWKAPASREAGMTTAQRQQNSEWGAAPFPSAIGRDDITYANFDVLMIPRGAKHSKEAFEFIAFVNSEAETEKLNRLGCQDSPLRKVSQNFLQRHPNPYIGVFERLLASPHAYGVPPCPIWPEVGAEIDNATQRVALLQATPEQALRDAQERVDEKYREFKERQQARQRSRLPILPPRAGQTAVRKTSGNRA